MNVVHHLSSQQKKERKKRNPLFPCANFSLVTINVLSSIVMYITNIVVESIIKIKN
jgi:hypothetical protein